MFLCANFNENIVLRMYELQLVMSDKAARPRKVVLDSTCTNLSARRVSFASRCFRNLH